MEQLLAHLVGDYLLQSDWMAQNKRRSWLPAAVHALVYSVAFLWLARTAPRPLLAWLVIFGTHAVIDRFGLARYVVWAKNWLGVVDRYAVAQYGALRNQDRWVAQRNAGPDWVPPNGWHRMPWAACSATGYSPDRPVWLAFWLLIIADNTLHLLLNYAALRWL
ncbi:MAG TPA: DUF3307 domain-containing protein [Acidobacteriaceae bacterium]|jgi:hypothetical protein